MTKKRKFESVYFKPLFISFMFLLGLFIVELFLFSQEQASSVVFNYLAKGSYFESFLLILLSFFSITAAAIFIGAAAISPYRCRFFYFALFCLAVMTEYGYQAAFNRFSNLEDAANAVFAADLRIKSNAIGDYFNYRAIVPCLLFGILLIYIKPVRQKGWLLMFSVAAALVVFFASTAYFTSDSFYTVSLSAFCRTVINFPTTWYVGTTRQAAYVIGYEKPRETVEFLVPNAPLNNIVFIVDESVRGDHLSLNDYDRPTTPFLEEISRRGLLKNWGIAVSGTTCSRTSNNLLLTGVSKLPDIEGKIYEFPTIFQYAKAMKYKTFYFDGQVSYFWNGKPSDLQDIDDWRTPDQIKAKSWIEMDAEIARQVREIVANSTGNFIWINKFGVHKPYGDSYPPDEKKWQPVAQNDDRSTTYRGDASRELIINDYDNALLYNSSSFFANLLENGLARNTFYVYTSDHGQSLNENGQSASHCADSKNEANVPLFIIADPQNLPPVNTDYRAAHANLFPTLLDLMNFPITERRENYVLSLFKAQAADSQPRVYSSGDLHSRDPAAVNFFDE